MIPSEFSTDNFMEERAETHLSMDSFANQDIQDWVSCNVDFEHNDSIDHQQIIIIQVTAVCIFPQTVFDTIDNRESSHRAARPVRKSRKLQNNAHIWYYRRANSKSRLTSEEYESRIFSSLRGLTVNWLYTEQATIGTFLLFSCIGDRASSCLVSLLLFLQAWISLKQNSCQRKIARFVCIKLLTRTK